MSDRLKPNSTHSQTKSIEDDKYLKIFKHLESVNSRNRAAFDELLRYTCNNVEHTDNLTSSNNKL